MEKVYGVIGDPIEHSLSPKMHNDLFAHYGLHAHYHAFHVKEHELKNAVDGIRALGISGFNITIPHKISIIDYLDEIEEVAANIGAVNTVVNVGGRFIGYNTDGDGFIYSLQSLITEEKLKQSHVLVLGAGGAARAIFISLAARGVVNIDICNRTEENAIKIIQDCKFKVSSRAISKYEAEKDLQKYNIIINTTSIGMTPHTEASPLSLQNISPQSIVSDIIYNPFETKLLIEARQRGAIVQNGIGMFVNQGALAFEKWTGIFPDTKRMNLLVTKLLGGTIC